MTQRVSLATPLFAGLVLTSCAGAPPPPDQIGTWHAPGYNSILEVAPAGVTLFERTSISCLQSSEEDNLEDLFEEDLNVRLTHPDTLEIKLAIAQTGYRLNRISTAERGALCPDAIDDEIDDPAMNFEIFWKTFDENYAFFDLHGVDWQASYDRHRGRVTPETARDELSTILVDMVAPLEDGHVLLAPDGEEPIMIFEPERIHLFGECRVEAPPCDDPIPYLKIQVERISEILKQAYLGGTFETALDDSLFWGRLSPDVGYLHFGSAGGFSDDDSSTKDYARLQPVLDRVFEDFADMPKLIVDLRTNGGGDDWIALSLADRLADEKRLVFTKAAFENGELTAPQQAFIKPTDHPSYRGEVIVLIGPATASAAEILTLALREMPYVTLMGEPTSGEFSDIHIRTLPNGMVFGLSNEVYRAADGEIFEGRGVPPDVAMPFSPLADREDGRDSMIDRALALFAEIS